jgi:hypothetical protein
MGGARPAVWAVAGLLALLPGCTADRIERGVFHSAKGYRVTLPRGPWSVEPRGGADLELRRGSPPGGMLADATCEGNPPRRPLPLLTRHLLFGLKDRVTLEDDRLEVGGLPAARTLVQGRLDGAAVAVEAVVLTDRRCVYDFLYVAPVAAFETGRADFRALVESFAGGAR